jgi:hypothetical protein
MGQKLIVSLRKRWRKLALIGSVHVSNVERARVLVLLVAEQLSERDYSFEKLFSDLETRCYPIQTFGCAQLVVPVLIAVLVKLMSPKPFYICEIFLAKLGI